MDKTLKNFALELLFPSFCLGCKVEGTFLCQDCKATLEISEYNYCLCSKDPQRLPAGQTIGKCSRCRDKVLAGLYSALPYKERVLTKNLIHNLKYEPYVKSLARICATIIIEHLALAKNLEPALWESSVFVPVPSEKSKEKERGYNQSAELAKEIAKTLPLPVITNNLIKIKKTAPQMKLSAAERAENLKGAFAIKKPAEIAGRKVFLVDDVYTTGSTMAECAKILKEAGAKQIWGIAFAREG